MILRLVSIHNIELYLHVILHVGPMVQICLNSKFIPVVDDGLSLSTFRVMYFIPFL